MPNSTKNHNSVPEGDFRHNSGVRAQPKKQESDPTLCEKSPTTSEPQFWAAPSWRSPLEQPPLPLRKARQEGLGSKTSFFTKSSTLTKMAGLTAMNANELARPWRIAPLENGAVDVADEVACAVVQVAQVAQEDPINLGRKTRPTLCA